ncbi:uncharacterized protein [Anoplolepis gracilipes]|uniref:uncharacterized protein n=1 Tax=Anoplolepis gracilipes TaxID=354296 RepID=UPI003B9F39AC
MESNIDYYYNLNKRFLSFVGQWPYQKPKEQRVFLLLFLFIVINGMITQIAQFVFCEDAQCVYETLPPHMLAVMVLVKIFTFYFNKRKIKVLTDRLFIDWDMFESQDEREIMRRYALTGRWYTVIYASYVYIGTMSFATTALVPRLLDVVFPLNTSRSTMLPYPAYYFVNEEKYFYYIFCHMSVTAELGLTGIVAHDCMLFVYIEHVCGLFAVIGFRFEHILYKHHNEKNSLISYSDGVYYKNIRFSIQAHRKALQFAILLENAFTISFGIQILIVTVGMSITLVQFSMQLHNLTEAMRYVVFLVGQLFHLFCFSFQGQKLINHSLEICDKIFQSSWYEIPVSAQRLLLMVMRKSMVANTLSAGKIYIFSLESFTTVLQTSMSYFTVLSSFRNMKSVWNYYYSMTKRMLLYSGQWPYQRRKERLLRVTVMTMTSLSMIVPQIGKFIQCNKDVQCILTIVPTHLFQLVVVVKLYSCQFNNRKIKDLTDQLLSDWKSLKTPEEYEIMKTYAAKARLFSLIYASYYFIAAPAFVLISLTPQILDIVLPLNESRDILLPYEAHYFVRDDTEYFYYIFFHALVGLVVVCFGLLAHDCMILTYIEHVCSIFAIAGFRFENLAYNENINVLNNNLDNIYNKKIALSVHAHWRALQFAELLEDTFSVTFIIQILIVTIAMSVTLLKIAAQSDDTMEAVRYIAFVIGQLIHLFCFSLQGQRLIDHSLQMRDKIYNGSWYKIPVKSQRMLLHVLRKCLQPNFLSAGKVYIFSLKSFTTVLQSSMSYFTVLASFE